MTSFETFANWGFFPNFFKHISKKQTEEMKVFLESPFFKNMNCQKMIKKIEYIQ